MSKLIPIIAVVAVTALGGCSTIENAAINLTIEATDGGKPRVKLETRFDFGGPVERATPVPAQGSDRPAPADRAAALAPRILMAPGFELSAFGAPTLSLGVGATAGLVV